MSTLGDRRRRRHGVVYSSCALGGGVGLPAGLSHKEPSEVVPLGGGWFLSGKATLADHILVSFSVLPDGRSIMNCPNCDAEQKLPMTASEVHTYVFC